VGRGGRCPQRKSYALPLPKHPGRQWGARDASLSHPPALRLGPPFGGEWVGQFLERNTEGQRALAEKQGWVGIPPELPQWRPMCFGSHATSNNRATSAAKGLFQVAPELCKRASAAAASTQELAVPVPTHLGRTSIASGKSPAYPPAFLVPAHFGRGCSTRGLSLPPTRPAAWLFFMGAGEAVCRVRQWPPTCFGTKRDGWVAGTHKRMGAPLSARLGRPTEKELYGCAECKQNARSGGFCHRLLYPAKEPVEVKHELLLTQARHGAHEVRTTP